MLDMTAGVIMLMLTINLVHTVALHDVLDIDD